MRKEEKRKRVERPCGEKKERGKNGDRLRFATSGRNLGPRSPGERKIQNLRLTSERKKRGKKKGFLHHRREGEFSFREGKKNVLLLDSIPGKWVKRRERETLLVSNCPVAFVLLRKEGEEGGRRES